MVRDPSLEIWPDSFDADIDARTANPCLHSIPDKAEQNPVQNHELHTVHAPGIAIGDGKADIVESARRAVEHDEDHGDHSAADNGDDGLPPDETEGDEGAADQVGGDVGVGEDPEIVVCPIESVTMHMTLSNILTKRSTPAGPSQWV